MKQLVILSGKGGTGKTSVAAAFAQLATAGNPPLRAILADADVDAANLELMLDAQTVEAHEFVGGRVARIDPDTCEGCGTCVQVCRFDAVHEVGGVFRVDPIGCEGCAVCYYQCPTGAIHMDEQLAGQWFRSDTRHGPLFHAALRPAAENSGKLVTMVKQQARLLALDEEYDLVVVDGPPGIGCPVISAAAGADLALLVTEPTVSGIHDLGRVLETTTHFSVRSLVCVNKADLYPAGTAEIEVFCQEHGILVAGYIPYDIAVAEAIVNGQPVTTYRPDSPASLALHELWGQVFAVLVREPA